MPLTRRVFVGFIDDMRSDFEIHNEAVQRAKACQRADASLLEILSVVDVRGVYRKMGYSSLHVYCVQALGLTDSQAYAFSGVAKKSKSIPELKALVSQNRLSVSNARRLVSVITPENKETWLPKGINLSQRELQKEIVKVNPEKAVPTRVRPLTARHSELRVMIPQELEAKLSQIQDILCQKQKRVVSLGEALAFMAGEFLERHDPVKKAKRNLCSATKQVANQPGKRRLPAQVAHQVRARDEGRCIANQPNGKRCPETKWLQIHHKEPLSQGGSNNPTNLETLCFHHHKRQHELRI